MASSGEYTFCARVIEMNRIQVPRVQSFYDKAADVLPIIRPPQDVNRLLFQSPREASTLRLDRVERTNSNMVNRALRVSIGLRIYLREFRENFVSNCPRTHQSWALGQSFHPLYARTSTRYSSHPQCAYRRVDTTTRKYQVRQTAQSSLWNTKSPASTASQAFRALF